MGTLESCPMWDIYGERRNLSEDYGRHLALLFAAKIFFFERSLNVIKCPQLSRKCPSLYVFGEENGLWIMEFSG